MSSAELTFEYLVGALEVTKGTPIAVPTHYMNMAGTVIPRHERYRPDEARGTLAEYYRSAIMRRWAEFSGEGPLDVYTLPFLLESLLKAPGTIATPGGGATSRTHTYAPTMTADDLLAMTLYWGDPDMQIFQASYSMVDEITVTADASGTDGCAMSCKGTTRFPAKTAPDSLPTMLDAPLLVPADLQLWVDGAGAIGTSEIADRVISAEFTIPSGNIYKYMATGPTGTRTFTKHARKKRHAELKLVLELTDTTQYDQWVADTDLKIRLLLNGPIIEGVLRHYVQFDIYGPFDGLDWGDLEGANRTVAFTILSEYNVAAGYDFQVVVQNDRATI